MRTTKTKSSNKISFPNEVLFQKASNLAKTLKDLHLTVATVESLTGGLISAALTSVPGSSLYFLAGLTVYSDEAKSNILGVPKNILNSYGAVSSKCSVSMAENVCRLVKSDLGLSTTGIAGPDGATPQKPLGLVFISATNSQRTYTSEYHFSGSRHEIVMASTLAALDFLTDFLS
ncbi:MAG: CinA family protein [Deltaproteobacteria bacterium]|nr:CinA family protein [Deltaproteobacteria bacterium]